MKLLLTNDDGIDAPGLAALVEAVRGLGSIVVAAPNRCLSGCSHQVTTAGALRLECRQPGTYAVAGTPADCVRVALYDLAPDVTWVLAGINAGGNLGADVHHSGTVAGIREAVLHGKPGIALSYYRRQGGDFDWERAVAWVKPLLRKLMAEAWWPGVFWNINLPSLERHAPDPAVVYCPLDPNPLPLSFHRDGDLLHYNGNYHGRKRSPGTDVDVCFGGNIAVTRIVLF